MHYSCWFLRLLQLQYLFHLRFFWLSNNISNTVWRQKSVLLSGDSVSHMMGEHPSPGNPLSSQTCPRLEELRDKKFEPKSLSSWSRKLLPRGCHLTLTAFKGTLEIQIPWSLFPGWEGYTALDFCMAILYLLKFKFSLIIFSSNQCLGSLMWGFKVGHGAYELVIMPHSLARWCLFARWTVRFHKD